jgi:hypothetical protein
LDGVHPGYTGQAIVANFAIARLNDVLGLAAFPLNLSEIFAIDPYIDKDGDGWAPGPHYKGHGLTRLLFLFKDPDDTNPHIGATMPTDVWDLISNVLLAEMLNIQTMVAEAERLGVAPPSTTAIGGNLPSGSWFPLLLH